MALLEIEALEKNYRTRFGGHTVAALNGISFSVSEGEFVAIMGESGSGKTTLLNIVATLDRQSAGRVSIDGCDTRDIGDRELARYRREHLGFVFQDFNLLETFSLRDNIYLPMVLTGRPLAEMRQTGTWLADRLGIGHLLDKYPYEVSGGEKQRAAIARALMTAPRLLLADEPTGALDSRSADAILHIFEQFGTAGQTILMVTHSVKAASHAGRVLFIRDGLLVDQLYRQNRSDEAMFAAVTRKLAGLNREADDEA